MIGSNQFSTEREFQVMKLEQGGCYGADWGLSRICDCQGLKGKDQANTCAFSLLMPLSIFPVLCFLLAQRWHRCYCFVKCKEWLNRWISWLLSCAFMFCPYFVPVVTWRQPEEGIDPRLRAAGCQLCSASAHLFGGIFVLPGEGDKHTIIPLKETSGKNHHRALTD